MNFAHEPYRHELSAQISVIKEIRIERSQHFRLWTSFDDDDSKITTYSNPFASELEICDFCVSTR